MRLAKKTITGRTRTAKMKPHGPAGSARLPNRNSVPLSAKEMTRVTTVANQSNTATSGGKRRNRNANANCIAIPVATRR
ncbi:MAG: hypothetical protein L6Q35_00410 [Phycisphaerales bacterium]|nr:hypothetical protein [Phycisphaerales bacterium]